MIVANTPWSGHYQVPAAVWTVAHTTQFVQARVCGDESA